MKKLAAVAILALVVFAGVKSSRVSAQPTELDEALVNARIDARLHEILTTMLQHPPRDPSAPLP